MFSRKRLRHAAALTTSAALAIALLAGCSAGPAQPAPTTLDPDEKVSISLSFWGNDVRAKLYDEAVAAFEKQNPNIDVKVLFLAPAEYWEKRQVEAAGGGLPDVLTMDLAYLRQYAENGTLLDLDPYLGSTIQTEPLSESVLTAGVVDGVTSAVPLATNSWGLFLNTTILAELGIEPFSEGSWADYYAWLSEVSTAAQAAGKNIWGGVDPTSRFTNFELYLRAQGSHLFSDTGEPGFDRDDLTAYWSEMSPLLASKAVVPQQRLSEINPLTGFDAALSASDTTWDNSGSGFLGNLGEGHEIDLIAPPLNEADGKDLYLKASQMYSIAATTKQPVASAMLIDFLVNSPESGQIFGTNRGLPASSIARDAADLDEMSQKVADYEASITDRLGDAPPVPIVGYGSLHEKFRELAEELNFGTLTVDEAVTQFFTEMDVILAQ